MAEYSLYNQTKTGGGRCKCTYMTGTPPNATFGSTFQNCPCPETPSLGMLAPTGTGGKNLSSMRGYNPNNPFAGNSLAFQQADLERGQLVQTATGVQYRPYPAVSVMRPIDLYAKPSSPVTPKVSHTRALAKKKRKSFVNMGVQRTV